MRTKPSKERSPGGETLSIPATQTERLKGIAAWWSRLDGLPKAQKRARMIELGILTPEGKIPVYPMDHIPLGPRN